MDNNIIQSWSKIMESVRVFCFGAIQSRPPGITAYIRVIQELHVARLQPTQKLINIWPLSHTRHISAQIYDNIWLIEVMVVDQHGNTLIGNGRYGVALVV